MIKKIDPVISAYMSSLGKKSGEKNKKKGSKYFSEIGKKGMASRWGKKLSTQEQQTANNKALTDN